MTRAVRDAALLLDVIAGTDERDLLSLPADPTDCLASCEGRICGLRVAWSPTLGYAKVDPEVVRIPEAAARSFEGAPGCEVEAADPSFESPQSSFAALWIMSYALRQQAVLSEWESRMDLDLLKLIRGALRIGPADYGEALAKRLPLWNTTRKFFDQFELLLNSTLPVPPFAVGLGAPEGIPDNRRSLASVSGVATIHIPVEHDRSTRCDGPLRLHSRRTARGATNHGPALRGCDRSPSGGA